MHALRLAHPSRMHAARWGAVRGEAGNSSSMLLACVAVSACKRIRALQVGVEWLNTFNGSSAGRTSIRLKHQQLRTFYHLVANRIQHVLDHAVGRRCNRVFHFHCFHDQ